MRSGIVSQGGGGGQRRHRRTASPQPTPSALSLLCSFLDPAGSTSSGRCVSEGITVPGPATLTDSHCPGTPGCAHRHTRRSPLPPLPTNADPPLLWLGSAQSPARPALFHSWAVSPDALPPPPPAHPRCQHSAWHSTDAQYTCVSGSAPTWTPGQPDPMLKLFRGNCTPTVEVTCIEDSKRQEWPAPKSRCGGCAFWNAPRILRKKLLLKRLVPLSHVTRRALLQGQLLEPRPQRRGGR